ncbi:hypothetical protein HMPREF1869_01446 [Bacteroidales bacterium KA00251]|nr:hypothetical protein HMPREF1869_01446 [Bacteroidales bacterium KA00251]
MKVVHISVSVGNPFETLILLLIPSTTPLEMGWSYQFRMPH